MDRCDTCGREHSYGATISVTGRGTYCSPCYNAWAAEKWGVGFDNAELGIEILHSIEETPDVPEPGARSGELH
jgi:hypothetical protein